MRVWIFSVALLILPGRILGGDSGNAPELSKAMKSAASGDQTPIEGARSSHSNRSHNADCDDSFAGSFLGSIFGNIFNDVLLNWHGVHYRELDCPWHLPVDAEYVIPLKGNIQGITRFSITPLSVEGERAFFGFYLNGGIVDMKHNSLPAAATSTGWTIGCGAAFRYYFVSPDKAINPYLSTRVGWMDLHWDYRNPVVLGGGGTVSSDSLSGLDTYAGMGIAYNRNQPFSLYAEVGFGGTFFVGETSQGFRNDVFCDFGYVAVKAGLSLKF